MEIRAFHVKDGDCLLIRGDDGTRILVDGGRATPFEDHVLPTLANLDSDIDLLCVSHIDEDHISGVLRLIETEIKWRVNDVHANDPEFNGEPSLPRPAAIREIWHNGFSELVNDDTGRIEGALQQATQTLSMSPKHGELFSTYENLTNGVRETLELNYRLQFAGFNDIWNPRSTRDDFLMVLSDANESFDVGGLRLHLLGPTTKALRDLRKFWNDWLDDHDLDVPALRRAAEQEAQDLGLSVERAFQNLVLREAEHLGENADRISKPNIASLTVLLEDGNKRVLLTGDARSEELLEGLRQRGLITDTQGLHVDVLKVQHHGAAGNVTADFLRFVTADHYIFCGNGNHTNPERVVLQGILDHRIGPQSATVLTNEVDQPFTFWFTSHSTTPGLTDNQREFLASIEETLDNRNDPQGRVTLVYPQDDAQQPGGDPFSVVLTL